MSLSRFIAQQVSRPSGLVGRIFLPRLFNRRNRALNDFTLQRLALQPDDRLLEVGFGGGYLLEHAARFVTQRTLYGIDASIEMVTFCQKRFRKLVQSGRMELRCAIVEALPYEDTLFTCACSVNTIFYWQNPQKALSELRRVLQDGGRIVLCFTDKASLETRNFSQHGLRLFKKGEVRQLLSVSGFINIRLTSSTDRHRTFNCVSAEKYDKPT